MQNAERTKYLAGDIDISRQSFGLTKEALDLNQDNINFNKKMLVANTIIQGTQAAVSLTQAAVGLGQAIYNHKNNKALDKVNDLVNYRNEQIERGALSYNPYDENGNRVGWGDYKTSDGRTIKEIDEDIAKAFSKKGGIFKSDYFGNIALKDLERRLGEGELKANKVVFQRVLNEQEAMIQNRMTDIQKDLNDGTISMDIPDAEIKSELENRVREAIGTFGMSNEQVELRVQSEMEKLTTGKIQHDAINLTVAQGIDDAEEYLSKQDLTDTQRSEIRATAQNESSRVEKAVVTAAVDRYNEVLKNTDNIGTAAQAARDTGSQNSDHNSAVNKEINRLQESALDQKFFGSLRDSGFSMTLEELQTEKKKLTNRRGEYEGHEYQGEQSLYIKHQEYLDRLIDDKKSGSGSGRDGTEQQLLSDINILKSEYHNRDNPSVNRNYVLSKIDSFLFSEYPKVQEAAIKLSGELNALNTESGLVAKEVVLLNQTILNNRQAELDELISKQKDGKASAREIADHKNDTLRILAEFNQVYGDGTNIDQLAQHMELFIKDDIKSRVYRTNMNQPEIKNRKDAAVHIAATESGAASAYSGQTNVSPQNPNNTTPNIIGGDQIEKQNQAATISLNYANKQLKGLAELSYDQNDPSNKDGTLKNRFKDKDGNVYRVNSDGTKKTMNTEILINGKWEDAKQYLKKKAEEDAKAKKYLDQHRQGR